MLRQLVHLPIPQFAILLWEVGTEYRGQLQVFATRAKRVFERVPRGSCALYNILCIRGFSFFWGLVFIFSSSGRCQSSGPWSFDGHGYEGMKTFSLSLDMFTPRVLKLCVCVTVSFSFTERLVPEVAFPSRQRKSQRKRGKTTHAWKTRPGNAGIDGKLLLLDKWILGYLFCYKVAVNEG